MTLGANAKACMDNTEFAKYLSSTILPLYPDTVDLKGKRVTIIIGTSPGKLNATMLAQLRIRGFYLIPGIPNTIHVTQAIDRNYGIFKSVYRDNLVKLSEHGVKNNKTIQSTNIPILIFGGGPQDIGPKNSFDASFGYEKDVNIWAEIWGNPFDRIYLLDDKVKHEVVLTEDGAIDIDADPLSQKLLDIENMNKWVT